MMTRCPRARPCTLHALIFAAGLALCGRSPEALAADPVDDAFRALDGNGDGVLSGTEAATVMKYDRNGDHEITRDEFQSGWKADHPPTPPASLDRKTAEARFHALDINQDGVLSGTERLGSEAYDADHDGHVTLDEYLAGVLPVAPADDADAIYVIDDEAPTTVRKTATVRLLGQGIAGGSIKADVLGPAKISRAVYLHYLKGEHEAIGGLQREFELTFTGLGDVTVVITVEYPNDVPTKVTVYRIKVRDPNAPPKA
jgi:EF hand domain-containing protein